MATVWVDGRVVGFRLPLDLGNLAAGWHKLEVVSTGYEPWSGTLQMPAEGRAEMRIELVAKGPCPRDMVLVAGGEQPARKSTPARHIDAFCLDRTEVTVAAYRECYGSGGCDVDALACDAAANWGVKGRDEHPINCVSWPQARTYCARVSKRLPTDLEWTWAASNGDQHSKFSWGDAEPGGMACWSGAGARSNTCSVYEFGAENRWGALGLAGNVWEWVEDAYDASNRARRGGGFLTTSSAYLRATHRGAANQSKGRFSDLGFRCASEPSK